MSENTEPHNPEAISRSLLLRWLGWFAVGNALLLSIIGFQYPSHFTWPEDSLAQLYVPMQIVGHFSFLAFLVVIPLSVLLVILPKRGILFPAAIIAYSVLALLVQGDTFVFALNRFHLNAMVWNLITGGAAGEILTLDVVNVVVGLILLAVLLAAQIWLASWCWRRVTHQRRCYGSQVALLIFTVMLVGQGIYAYADFTQHTPVLRQVRMIPWPMPITVKGVAKRFGVEPADRPNRVEVGTETEGEIKYPLRALQCQKRSDLNLMVLVLDGLRADALTPEVMPNLSRLVEKSTLFENHFSAGNSTRFGLFGLFYGLHGTYWYDMLREQKGALLIKQLKRSGYRFGLYGSARLTSPEFHRTVFADVPDAVPPRTQGETVVDRDYEVNRLMSTFLREESKQPFFGFVLYDAPHGYVYPDEENAPFQPAWPSVNYVKLSAETDPTGFVNRYRNAVHFDDQLLGKLISQMEEQGLLENTVIVVTGDHGKEFNDTGGNYWGHNGNFSRFQTQVPLVVYWPGREPARYSHRTSHVDVAPTLMRDIFKCRADVSDYSNGRFLDEIVERPYLVSSSWEQFSIIGEEEVTVINKLGQIDVYDQNYRLKRDAKPNSQALVQTLGEMSRFYKKD